MTNACCLDLHDVTFPSPKMPCHAMPGHFQSEISSGSAAPRSTGWSQPVITWLTWLDSPTVKLENPTRKATDDPVEKGYI